MLDAHWLETWHAIQGRLRARDRLLLPPGDWPASWSTVRFYGSTITIGDSTFLALHKGRLGAITKPTLRSLMKRWEIVFANEVFVCFRKPRLPRLRWKLPRHTEPHAIVLLEFLHSCKRKRIPQSIYLAHLPKTAGTALWNTLSPDVPSSIYYDSLEMFRDRPPDHGDYDLIGGHVPLPLLMRSARAGDTVTGLIRDPVARLRSAFLHSRRPREDATTFTPIMRLMRERPLAHVLRTEDGQMEARQQLLMMGFDFKSLYKSDCDETIFASAARHLDDPRCCFEITERLDVLAAELAGRLCCKPPVNQIGVHNGSAVEASASDIAEFEAAMPEIMAATVWDRRLYELVRFQSEKRLRATAVISAE